MDRESGEFWGVKRVFKSTAAPSAPGTPLKAQVEPVLPAHPHFTPLPLSTVLPVLPMDTDASGRSVSIHASLKTSKEAKLVQLVGVWKLLDLWTPGMGLTP